MRVPAGPVTRAPGWARWYGWRRLAVAAGSIAIHLSVFGLIALSLGASRSEEPKSELRRYQPMALDFVTLDLVASEPQPQPQPLPEPEAVPEPPPRRELPTLEPPPPELPEPEPPKPEPPKVEPPPAPEPPEPEPPKPEPIIPEPEVPPPPEPPRLLPEASVTPPPRTLQPPAPRPEPTPEPPRPEPTRPEPPKPAPAVADPRKDKETSVDAPAPVPASPSADASGSVFLPPSSVIQPGGGPAGLRNLAYGNPCESRFGKKPKECVDDWTARVGTMDSVMPRSKDELRQQFADYIEPCPWKVGCEGGEWVSNNGTRSVFGTSQHGGAASAGGIHDTVGRLPQNPDFTDPGFGD